MEFKGSRQIVYHEGSSSVTSV